MKGSKRRGPAVGQGEVGREERKSRKGESPGHSTMLVLERGREKKNTHTHRGSMRCSPGGAGGKDG